MNSYDFFIYEFICFMNSYMNSGVPRFQMLNPQSTTNNPCPFNLNTLSSTLNPVPSTLNPQRSGLKTLKLCAL